ncbi:hypothetical protein F503_03168 [Ophiostoma piceae UAMH 11346]|uniref:Uncharacterized protein n=1 Tax=Ophiostoma piceae (strain UAMH 11346) TaxID=1262450 RepID=S3C4J3_OPHP1|nr:hypothetical protein F503_03168 [Ophiostoma piceae UAMH 11346]
MVDLFGPIYHGDPNKLRREVLSTDLIDSGKVDEVMLSPRSHLKSIFLDEIAMLALSPHDTGRKLLILVLCPAILGDCADNRRGGLMPISLFNLGPNGGEISIDDIRSEIPSGVETTLVTPSYFSEGWLVEKNFHLQVPATPKSQYSIDTMALTCGSAFVAAVVEDMAGLRVDENGESSNWGPFREEAYNKLCNSAYRICGRGNIVRDELFVFWPRNTEWERSWDDTTRSLFAELDARWKRLKLIRPARLYLDPDNTAISYQDEDAPVNPRLQYVIKQYLLTCPLENRSYLGIGITDKFLLTCGKHGRAMEPQSMAAPMPDYLRRNAWETLNFRVCYALAVDYIVARLELPMPGGKRAFVFDIEQWILAHTEGLPINGSSYFEPHFSIYCKLGELLRPAELRPRLAQGGAYLAMNGYLTASLFEFFKATDSFPETIDKVQEIKNLVNAMANYVRSYALTDVSLVHFAENVRNEHYDLEMEEYYGLEMEESYDYDTR